MTADSKQRFSNRVEHYVRARPHYPPAVIEFMRVELGLRPEHVIADVGSGTGILTGPLLANGNVVYAIEPNEPMRLAAERMLRHHSTFHSIDGTAEQTHLESASVDFVTAAQAFHWFDPQRARAELKRILKPGGWVVLMWNDRRHERPPFSVEYHRVIRQYNSDLDRINHQNVSRDDSDALRRFFGGEAGSAYQSRTFDNFQDLDWDGVQGRLFSSSYMPTPDDPRAASMLAELKRAFDAHQQSGKVRIEYDTRVFWGRLL